MLVSMASGGGVGVWPMSGVRRRRLKEERNWKNKETEGLKRVEKVGKEISDFIFFLFHSFSDFNFFCLHFDF